MLTIYYKLHNPHTFFSANGEAIFVGSRAFWLVMICRVILILRPHRSEYATSAPRRERAITCPTLTGATNITGESGRHQSNMARVYLFTHEVHNETQLRRWSQVCLLMLLTGQQKLTKQNYSKATDERRDFFSFEVDGFSAYCTSVE